MSKLLAVSSANLTNAERFAVLKKVESMMAAQILKETGAVVEFTCCGVNKFSVCGSPKAVDAAMAWMVGTGSATENERIHDDKIDETFCYFTTHA
jgi:hypothetical protein